MNGMSLDQFKWYVVRAVTGQEKKVKAQLESELERAGLLKHVPQLPSSVIQALTSLSFRSSLSNSQSEGKGMTEA